MWLTSSSRSANNDSSEWFKYFHVPRLACSEQKEHNILFSSSVNYCCHAYYRFMLQTCVLNSCSENSRDTHSCQSITSGIAQNICQLYNQNDNSNLVSVLFCAIPAHSAYRSPKDYNRRADNSGYCSIDYMKETNI